MSHDSCKQILNSLHMIEVNLRSTTPNRRDRQIDGRIFLNYETYENDDIFFYIILEYDRPNLDRSLPRDPNVLLVWQDIEIVKSSKFNDFNCQ